MVTRMTESTFVADTHMGHGRAAHARDARVLAQGLGGSHPPLPACAHTCGVRAVCFCSSACLHEVELGAAPCACARCGRAVRLGYPNHQAWCEVESARDSLKQTTRHEAGLEAMGELQNAWRRLKRDEKVCVCSQLPIALGLVRARLSPLARAALLQPGGREGALVAAAARAQHALPDGLGVLQAVGKALGKLREQCDHLKVCHGIARVLCAAPCSPC